jgi:hypothetical protein
MDEQNWPKTYQTQKEKKEKKSKMWFNKAKISEKAEGNEAENEEDEKEDETTELYKDIEETLQKLESKFP